MQDVRTNNFSALLAQEAAIAPNARVFFQGAARYGRLEMCQWLHATYDLTSADARADDNCALRYAAEYGHLSVCRWLHATFHLTAADARTSDNYALRWAAARGHLAVCQWLHTTYGLTSTDARARNNDALCVAAGKGLVAPCQWLHATYGLTAADWDPHFCHASSAVAAWIRGLRTKARLRELAAELTALAE